VGKLGITAKSRFSSGNTAFIGGNVISYILAKTTGEIITADTLIGLAHLNYQLSAKKDPLFKRISLANQNFRQ